MESEHSLPTGPQSVLVVDDTGVVRMVVFRILSDVGYRVLEADSAVEAVEVMTTSRFPIRLVIVDVVMPTMSGVDLARMIRDRWPGTAILFMSAHPAEILVRHGLADPAVHFLAKPFTRDELVLKVVAALVTAGVPDRQEIERDA